MSCVDCTRHDTTAAAAAAAGAAGGGVDDDGVRTKSSQSSLRRASATDLPATRWRRAQKEVLQW